MARGTFQHTARRCTAARGCAAVRRSCLALHGRRCQVGHSESPAATPRATSAARQALRRSSGVLKASDFSGAPTRYAPASPAMIRGGALPSAVQRAAKLGFAAVSGLVTGQGRRAPFGHNATFCQSLGTHSKGAPQAAPCAQLLSPAVSAERQVHASSSPGEQLRVISRGGAYGGPAPPPGAAVRVRRRSPRLRWRACGRTPRAVGGSYSLFFTQPSSSTALVATRRQGTSQNTKKTPQIRTHTESAGHKS